MNQNDRRKFLKFSTILGTSFLSTSKLLASSSSKAIESSNSINHKKQKTRILGSGEHRIEVNYGMGLGCMGMTWNRTFIPDAKHMTSLLQKAYDMGVNLFDTAEAYGPFGNEILVGNAIKGFRKNIILCSKFGFNIQDGKLKGLNSNPKHIREAVEQSLIRLNTDYIDLLYQHRPDPKVPIEVVASTVKDLIQEGKVKHFGLSEAGISDIRKAHAIQPLTALQTEFSLLTRQHEENVMAVCEELGIGFVPYSPLSRGYLTGYINERTQYDAQNDNRPNLPRYTPDAVKANWPIIKVLENFGNDRGYTVAQVALAWIMAQKNWIVPIPGTTKQAHLQENLWASAIELSTEELNQLTTSIETIPIMGSRYPAPPTK